MCFGAGMYLLGIISSLLTLLSSLISPIFNYNRPRNVLKISVHMNQNGLPEIINKCLERLNYYHIENRLRSYEGTGWYLDTEIITYNDVDPNEVVRELKKIDSVIDVRIK